MINIENLNYKYKNGEQVLEDINLKINEGEVISIIGKNGSGKSTLARLISGITLPTNGKVLIDDIDTKNKKEFIELRKKIGIVFQNPENQIIFNNVHDDIIFALNNLGIEDKEERIKESLKEVGMEEYINKPAYELSLGQKQRVTIAGVLSIKPKYIIMDEPTAMLDPEGKNDIREIVKKLKNLGFTIIYITNIIEEIFISDRIIVLEKGKVVKEIENKDLMEHIDFLRDKGLTIPKEIEIQRKLKSMGIDIGKE